MKKILFWIFSVALSLSASAATPMHKSGGAKRAITAEAQMAPVSTSRFHVAPVRSIKNATGQLASAKSHLAFKSEVPVPTRVIAANESWPDMVGIVAYSDFFTQDSYPYVAKVNNGSLTSMFDLSAIDESPTTGVVVDGVYYVNAYMSFWGYLFITNYAFDLESGELLASKGGEITDICLAGMTVDPTTGNVYGIGYNSEGSALELKQLTLVNDVLSSTTSIAQLDGNWNSIMCDAQGQLYGIGYEGVTVGDSFTVTNSTLYKINKANGALTVVGGTGMLPQYLSSATIDSKTGKCYWNVNTPDDKGFMAEVNLGTGAATKLFDLPGNEEIFGLCVMPPAAEEGAPATVEELSALFQDGSLSGKINFKSPSTTYAGTAASGALTYKITANGDVVAQGNTTFGATNAIDLTLSAPGRYTFAVTVANNAGTSPVAKVTTYVGFGVPETPVATLVYENGNMNLSWTAVTATVDGGYIDPAAVTYTVTRYPDEVKVADNIAVTAFSEPMTTPGQITSYHYTVVAHSNGIDSQEGVSNTVTLGSIVPPYTQDFGSADALAGWTILDGNADGKVWMINNGELRIAWNSSKTMDDWAIMPPMYLEAGKVYNVQFDARANSTVYAERIEVKWGTAATAQAMTNIVLDPTDITENTYTTFAGYVVPQTTGTYYIGFHGISDPDTYYLYIDNIVVESTVATSPGACTDIVITPDANGELKATVAFKAPAVNIGGSALTANLTEIKVSRDGAVVKTFTNVQPGASLSFEDVLTEGGDVEYVFVAYNADGEGAKATATAFIGVDAPAAPTNVKMVEIGNTAKVTISWDAVTTDKNGNAINPSLVTYQICAISGGYIDEVLVDNITTTSAELETGVAAGQQDFVQYALVANTSGGYAAVATPMVAVGTPYDGMMESFADGTLSYIWGTGYSAAEGAWSINDASTISGIEPADGDNGYAAMKGQYLDSSSALFTGKILIPSVNPGVSYYTYNIIGDNGANDINEMEVLIQECGTDTWTSINTVVINQVAGDVEGWFNVTFGLEAYAGKTVQVRFQATTKMYVYTMLDAIKIGSLVPNDLAAGAIQAPATVKAGSEYTVDVNVRNNGTADATEFSVELYADGNLAETKTVESLETGKATTVSFDLTMSPIAAEPVVYTAKVVYAADQNPDNNTTAEVSVAPKFSNLPVVESLKGEEVAEGVKLTWNEPNLEGGAAETVTDDFEDCTSWAQEIEGWTFIDQDGSEVGGFQNTELPGMTAGESKASFFVFDTTGDTFNQTFDAHSGTKYLAALFRWDDGTTSDWAISPALSGNAQTIGFYARSYSTTYPEKIEVCYSTTGTEVADFQVVKTLSPVPGEWTLVEADLPAGATYFAIHSCATGSFMLMIDDVTYERGSATAHLVLKGYDVYRAGEKIATVEETEFIDGNAVAGENSYAVLAVYETGTSAPEFVTVSCSGVDDMTAGITIAAVKGAIIVKGAEGKQVVVNAVDGKTVFAGEGEAVTTVNVGAGIYLVKADTKVAKVIVK